jgi:hypothetical protein
MKKRILSLIPFLIISFIILYTWAEIFKTNYTATFKHYVTLLLIMTNGVCYLVKYKLGIILTAIILILATFNLLSFYTVTQTSSLGINLGNREIKTPEIQLSSLFLLLLYCVINFNSLVKWYLDKKDNKEEKKFNV